ncbi:DNA methyltransferase [Phaeodactylibacter xiamenensis]|uniref:DNA methyltransferase n=1 Tax=Phaeodactylibacter xiamenensis TaxID=1524460 RepID=UPI0024A91E19|nr:DNA methyltransferase [Phaeodactylibacter xiamenensis]
MQNKFLNIDCLDEREGLPSYPDNFFDLAIVDPQYKIGASKPSKKGTKCKQKNGTILHVKESDYGKKTWDDNLMPNRYFQELKRVSKRQIIWGANYQNFPLRGGRLVWDKVNGASDQYDCEIAYLSWTLRTEIVYFMWNGMMQGLYPTRDIRKAWRQQGNKSLNEKRYHPTQKPVALYKWILEEYAQPGDTILDTHVGSASSLLAFDLLGFNYHAFEIDVEIYQAAAGRLKQSKKPTLFLAGSSST